MASSRLPGKVMERVDHQPLLGHLIKRVRRTRSLTGFVVSTSVNAENDVIEEYCLENGVGCFRGAEDDVLGRTLASLKSTNADIGVTVFGDCPLLDPNIIDYAVELFLDRKKYDFVGNNLRTTYPPGMDVEVYRTNALEDSDRRTTDIRIREHGTLYIRQHPERYSLKNFEATKSINRPDLYLGLDTQEDLAVVKEILNHFQGKVDYSLEEIIHSMDANPQLAESNRHIYRRWKKYRNS